MCDTFQKLQFSTITLVNPNLHSIFYLMMLSLSVKVSKQNHKQKLKVITIYPGCILELFYEHL